MQGELSASDGSGALQALVRGFSTRDPGWMALNHSFRVLDCGSFSKGPIPYSDCLSMSNTSKKSELFVSIQPHHLTASLLPGNEVTMGNNLIQFII